MNPVRAFEGDQMQVNSPRPGPLPRPRSALSSGQSISQDDHLLECYPLEDIVVNQNNLESSTRRLSAASLLSTTSSQARRTNRTLIWHAWQKISTHTRSLHSRLTHKIQKSRYHGWRMGVLVGCCMSAFVLCCNIAIVVIGSQIQSGYHDGIADLKIGPATAISQWSTAAHLLINILSTMLLGASNYTMQVLSSPTRKDIDKAHASGKWLDVGILSTRNLWNIPRTRAAVWCLLATSSIPLHLFYNAAIFQVATENMYNIFAVDITSNSYEQLQVDLSKNTTHRELPNSAWKKIYNTPHVFDNGDLYLILDKYAFVSTQDSATLSISDYYPIEISGTQQNLQDITGLNGQALGDWIDFHNLTQRSQSIKSITKLNVASWPESAHVVRGITKIIMPKSRLQISLTFMLVVICFNLLKLCIMTWVLFTDRSAYLVTLGDALASFLEEPDLTTRNRCILSKEEMLFMLGHPPYLAPGSKDELETLSLRSQGMWLPRRREYFFVLGRDRQVFFSLLFCVTLSANVVGPLIPQDGYAWGTSSNILVNSGAGTLTNAWIVNTPQLALSFCYLALNSICTSLASANEWNNLARGRKALRVTDPRGQQRSTYFLQLPYRWAAPLIIVSGTLHWLLSQSFFLVRLDMLTRDNRIESKMSSSACGFSPISMYVFWGVALSLVVSIGTMANRRLQQKMPLAASCSLVISAACHPPDKDNDVHLGKVRWGVVTQQIEGNYEHCCLTTLQGTKKPVVGRTYR